MDEGSATLPLDGPERYGPSVTTGLVQFAVAAVTPVALAVTALGPAASSGPQGSAAAVVAAAPATVDEVKYSFGDTPDAVVFSWHGAESTLYYGSDDTYGQQATAVPSAISPVDTPGPFMEVRITGLQPGTAYSYRLGADGPDGVFRTAPAVGQGFTAVAMGDTVASTCRPFMPAMNTLVAGQQPDFVIHHGDISTANECGQAAVHQYFLDIEQTYSRRAAFMPVWGNHEYGPATSDAPYGTPRDTLANYKGRLAVAHPQTVPSDTAAKTGNPGCGAEIGSRTNTCRGEDWGWFRAGAVVFISVPEPWSGAITDWRTKVTALMQQAQGDPTVDFVVTYSHRPPLSSTSYTAPAGFLAAFDALATAFAPSATHPAGKYVLNLSGHRHNIEVFGSRLGLMHVVNGAGGQGLIKFGSTVSGSTFRMKHLGFSTLSYDAAARALTFRVICGPSVSYQVGTCTAGSTIFTRTFTTV
jgi:hypothetical protein